MEEYVNTIKKNAEAQRTSQRRTKQRIQIEMKTSFLFHPNDQILNQIRQFEILQEKKQWNGNLRFCNFSGSFKIEYWIHIEKQLRQCNQLKKIKFTKTKLGAQHLHLLLTLLIWLQPSSIEIELNHNELDDLNIQDFSFNLIKSELHFKYLIISNNPGIFRGQYLEKLSSFLEKQMTFNLSINQHYKSIILYNKRLIDEKSYSQIQKKLKRMRYHSLNMSNCFTESNYSAFEFLVQKCFNESSLETLLDLNISNNYLGPITLVESLFQRMAFSKGLLKLGLSNLETLTFSACQQLIGNRYSELRLLELDLSNNPELEESALQILLDKIISKSCTQFSLENTFINNSSILTKLYLFSQAFRNRIKQNEKLALEKLDLSAFESIQQNQSNQYQQNQQQNDLIEDVLKFAVFNNFSSTGHLIINNLNDGICLSYINAISEYQLQAKKYKLPLNVIEVRQQNLPITEDIAKEFFINLLFTKENQFLEIETVKFENYSFELDSRCFMFTQFLNSLNGYKNYSLQHIQFINTFATNKLIEKALEVFLLQQIFHLHTFIFKENNFNDYIQFDTYLYSCKFIERQPDIKMFLLKSLTLDIVGLQMSTQLFLKCFINNSQVKLIKLKLANITLNNNSSIDIPQTPVEQDLELERVKVFNILDQTKLGIILFANHCLFNQFLDLQYIEISDIPYSYNENFKFYKLKKLCLYDKFATFELPLNIIINSEQLQNIVFKKVEINDSLNQAISKYFLIRKIRDGFCKINFLLESTKYFLKNAILSPTSYITFLLIITAIQKVQVLSNAKDQKIFQLKQIADCNALLSYYNHSQKDQSLKNTPSKLKSWNYQLLQNTLALIRKHLEELVLSNCDLNDNFMQGLNDLIQNAIEDELVGIKFLKFIDFSDNNQINTNAWNKFFDLAFSESLGRQQHQRHVKQNFDFSQQMKTILSIVEKNHLNIRKLQLEQQEKFIPVVPKKVTQMQIRFLLESKNEKEKKEFYFKHNLKIFDVDLDLFMKTATSVIDIQQEYSDSIKGIKKRKELNNVSKLSVTAISLNNDINTQSFCQLFLNNLVTLKISEVKNGFIVGFLNFLSSYNGKLKITKLELCRIEEFLNQNQSNQFLQDIIFGQKMPLKILKIIESITFKEDSQFVKDTISSIKPLLQKFIFGIENFDSFQYLLGFSKYLLESQSLQYIRIEGSHNVSLLFENIDFDLNIPKLNNLHLKSVVDLTPKLLEYISSNSTTLHMIKFSSVKISEKSKFINWCSNTDPITMDCKLVTKMDQINDEESQLLVKQFFGSKVFQWKNLKQRSSFGLKHFNSINLSQQFKGLLILEIDAKFETYSTSKISNEFLAYISENLIFHPESRLQELILKSCNITVTQIFKLVKLADEYRETNTKQLSLKRFCLSKSQSIDEEAFQELCNSFIFYDYMYIERLELVQINLSNKMIKKLIQSSQNWLKATKSSTFRFSSLNFAFNDTFGSLEAWELLCKTWLFSNLTPSLSSLFLNGMDIKNHIAKLIANTAAQFFNTKPINFIHSLKEINFACNKSINEEGWHYLSKYLFFHNKVNLKDIDINECQINQENNINQFIQPIYERVMRYGKLSVVKFRCDNIILKNKFFQLNNIPKSGSGRFKSLQNLPFKRAKYNGFGKIEGKITSFGVLTNNISKALNMYRRINLTDCWKNYSEVKFSCYHLNFVNHYLKILPSVIPSNEYSFSYYGLDQLFNYFIYPPSDVGSPYPLQGLFSNDSLEFFQTSSVSKLSIVETFFSTLEKPTQYDIWRIYNTIISKRNNLDLIEIEYTLNDDLVEYLVQRNYTERDIIKFIRVIPPSSIIIKNSLTLQAIKAIYSIMYENNYFQYSHISYDHRLMLNNGIGYSLQSQIYSINVQNRFLIILKKILYHMLSIFVSDASKFTFSSEIKKLNQKLQTSLKYFDLLAFLTIVYLFMCIGTPIILTIKDLDSREDLCKKGVNYIATYSYYGFALVSLIFESLLYKQMVEMIPSHIKKLVDVEQKIDDQKAHEFQKQSLLAFGVSNKITPLNENQHSQNGSVLNGELITRFNSNFKTFVNSSYAQIVQFLINITLSQLSKYDLYNDVVFIINCYTCNQYDLFNAALVITCINLTLYIIYFIEIIGRRIQRIRLAKKYLSTQTINDFFDLCTVGRNAALGQILDSVAPYNVSVFPNNSVIRKLIPIIAGKSINKSIRNYLLKFIFEDVPQLTLQLLFIYRMTVSNSFTLGWSIYITLSTSIIAIIISFLKFMQIRPSTISQADFDKLERNNIQIYDYKVQHLNEEVNQFIQYEQSSSSQHKLEQSIVAKNLEVDQLV